MISRERIGRSPGGLFILAVLSLSPKSALGSTGGLPPLPEDSTQINHANVPRDGVVAGQSECGPCDVGEVWITTVGGDPIEGVVTDLSDLRRVGAWAFAPSAPWQPGDYLARYADGEPAPFTVIDEPVSPPDIEPSLSSPIKQRRDHVQCVTAPPSPENPAGEFDTFSLTGWTHGYFHVETSGPSSGQYTYMVGVNGEVRFDPYSPYLLFEIGPGVQEICYWVRAQGLVSRAETLLAQECYSPALLDDYAVDNATAEEFDEFLRGECLLPPAGFFAQWCSVFQSALDAGTCSDLVYSNVEACESALSLCGGEEPDATPTNPDPTSTGGASSLPSSNASRDSGDSSGGCAVSPLDMTQGGGRRGLFLVLALVAVRLFRRKGPRENATTTT